MFFALLVGSVWIPNYVFDNNGYAWFARVVSVLFLVLQVLMLVDFGYKWNESWTDKADQNKTTDMDNDAVDTKWLYAIHVTGRRIKWALVLAAQRQGRPIGRGRGRLAAAALGGIHQCGGPDPTAA